MLIAISRVDSNAPVKLVEFRGFHVRLPVGPRPKLQVVLHLCTYEPSALTYRSAGNWVRGT